MSGGDYGLRRQRNATDMKTLATSFFWTLVNEIYTGMMWSSIPGKPSFLTSTQRVSTVKVISYNINNVYTKQEKQNVQQLLLDYDLISLNEVKTSLPVTFPGYVTYRSKMVMEVVMGVGMVMKM